MSNKFIIYVYIFVGSTLGSILPNLWGASLFSSSAIILGIAGGLLGLYLASRII